MANCVKKSFVVSYVEGLQGKEAAFESAINFQQQPKCHEDYKTRDFQCKIDCSPEKLPRSASNSQETIVFNEV